MRAVLVDALVVVVPALAALVVAWARQRRQRLAAARDVVVAVENEAPQSPGPEKKRMAVNRLTSKLPVSEERASRLVEEVLPTTRVVDVEFKPKED